MDDIALVKSASYLQTNRGSNMQEPQFESHESIDRLENIEIVGQLAEMA